MCDPPGHTITGPAHVDAAVGVDVAEDVDVVATAIGGNGIVVGWDLSPGENRRIAAGAANGSQCSGRALYVHLVQPGNTSEEVLLVDASHNSHRYFIGSQQSISGHFVAGFIPCYIGV